jgi:hypothetical protein
MVSQFSARIMSERYGRNDEEDGLFGNISFIVNSWEDIVTRGLHRVFTMVGGGCRIRSDISAVYLCVVW